MKDNKGFISLYVLLAMLFLLVFSFATYEIIESNEKNLAMKNKEVEKIYYKDYEQIENSTYASEDEIIPIYNIDEFNMVGSGNYMQIKDKIYNCKRSSSYLLVDNIICDIKEDIFTSYIGFNDYKLYSDSYHINQNNKSLYYYFENENGNYWKCIYYDKYVKSKSDENLFFNIINKINYSAFANKEFMIIWSSENGEMNNYNISSQKNTPKTVEEIDVFKKSKQEIDFNSGEFYILLNLGINEL